MPARFWAIALCFFILILSACRAAASNSTPPTLPAVTPTRTSSIVTAVSSPANTPTAQPLFDGKHAYDYLLAQMNFGPRPAGSQAIRATGDYILVELQKSGWQTDTQEFTFRGVPIRNILAKAGVEQRALIILGAHYDTRPRANMDTSHPGQPVPGANDGASGVAVLLELARTLDKAKLKNQVWLAFFDAEDNGDLDSCALRVVPLQIESKACDTTPWTWSIGADYLAEHLPSKPAAVIVLDMIGDADQNIYYEQNSDKALQESIWQIANALGYRQWFIPQYYWSMTDDHTPFLRRGIRAVDIIDFNYPAWHTTGDTADKVSADSLERVGRVMQTWLERGGIP